MTILIFPKYTKNSLPTRWKECEKFYSYCLTQPYLKDAIIYIPKDKASLNGRIGANGDVFNYMLLTPKGRFSGLLIEIMACSSHGKVSALKLSFEKKVNSYGYKTCIATGHKEAIEAINEYLKEN